MRKMVETMTRVGRKHHRRSYIFVRQVVFLSAVTLLIFLASAGSSAVTDVSADSSKVPSASRTSGGLDSCSVLFLVRGDFSYGVILTTNNSTADEDIVRFTFTYNSSLPVSQKIQIYQYTTNETLVKLPNGGIGIHYDAGSYYYVSKPSGGQICRFLEKGIETQLGVEYFRILVETQESSESGQVTWSSGYNIGMGATVLIHSNSGGGLSRGGPLSASIAVALTLTSLIPFFILLPGATKKLCQAVAETSSYSRRVEVNGLKLYVRILAIFTPLLCIGIVFLSVTTMLNALELGV